jgi:hypothetical protein
MPLVRTTIRIDDALYRSAKAAAARSGRTVSELIEDAIRVALSPQQALPGTVRDLPVYGGSGVLPGVDLADPSSWLDQMDDDSVASMR